MARRTPAPHVAHADPAVAGLNAPSINHRAGRARPLAPRSDRPVQGMMRKAGVRDRAGGQRPQADGREVHRQPPQRTGHHAARLQVLDRQHPHHPDHDRLSRHQLRQPDRQQERQQPASLRKDRDKQITIGSAKAALARSTSNPADGSLFCLEVVHPAGFEPTAPRLGIWCSIRLSYGCPRPL